jgi:hypothetical protein
MRGGRERGVRQGPRGVLGSVCESGLAIKRGRHTVRYSTATGRVGGSSWATSLAIVDCWQDFLPCVAAQRRRSHKEMSGSP